MSVNANGNITGHHFAAGPPQIDMSKYRYVYKGPEIFPPVPEVDGQS
jgi:hypothetical protein